ncbi:Uncharacterised protein g6236 [Pycnogonum litorale]
MAAEIVSRITFQSTNSIVLLALLSFVIASKNGLTENYEVYGDTIIYHYFWTNRCIEELNMNFAKLDNCLQLEKARRGIHPCKDPVRLRRFLDCFKFMDSDSNWCYRDRVDAMRRLIRNFDKLYEDFLCKSPKDEENRFACFRNIANGEGVQCQPRPDSRLEDICRNKTSLNECLLNRIDKLCSEPGKNLTKSLWNYVTEEILPCNNKSVEAKYNDVDWNPGFRKVLIIAYMVADKMVKNLGSSGLLV